MKINYNLNKFKKYQIFSNIIITTMLIVLIVITTSTSYSYVFNYDNSNIIYNGNKNSNKVSLMFNVYWGEKYIEDILKVLKNFNVKTTFFLGGSWVEKNQNLVESIINDGHEIGNHGYLHKDHDKLTYEQNIEEIIINHKLIKKIFNIKMNLFAPPSGAYNNSTIKSAQELGYQTIMWSKDTIDWRDKDSYLILNRATKNIKGGDLILMHPTEQTLKALPTILEFYKMNNLKPTTVSNCLI